MPEPVLVSTALLARLEEGWRAQGAPIVEQLQPGLGDGEIDALMGPLGITLPEEPRTWWRWHDGASAERYLDERSFGPFTHLPLRDAIEQLHTSKRLASELGPGPWWEDSWFPLLGTGHGPVVAFSHDVPVEAPVPVFEVDWHGGGGRTEPSARSLGEAVTWWIDALESGVWAYDREAGRWELHRERLSDSAREFTRLV